MNQLIVLHSSIFASIQRHAGPHIPTLARFVFAATLLLYFLKSGLSKMAGPFTPSLGAYYQIFPKAVDAVGGDLGKLGTFHWLVIEAGTYAEILLPCLIVAGLFTRLSALAMIGFIFVQSLTDIYGHGADAATTGGWFDAPSGSLIADQRTFWVFVLLVLVIKGAGPLSLDRLLSRQAASG